MNIPNLQFQIGELHGHVGDLLNRLRSGEITENDPEALSVELGHILSHVCLAWNLKDLPVEEYPSLSQDEFDRASNTIPSLGYIRTLSETDYFTYKLDNGSNP